MPVPALLAAVPSAAGAASSAVGKVGSVIGSLTGATARNLARINRRDFFLNAAKAGSVTAARYLLGGQLNTAGNEKREYDDGIGELNGTTVLAQARALKAMWPVNLSYEDGLDQAAEKIAGELQGVALNIPEDAPQRTAIANALGDLGIKIRNDVSEFVGNAAAGAGASAASAVAAPGSAQSKTVLIPTTQSAIIIGVLLFVAVIFLLIRKR